MLKLHELPGDPGKTQNRKRVGRGEGSGLGRSSGKGNKGHKARAGNTKSASFEGGQMPMIRRLPKFGFRRERFRAQRAEVTLRQLEQFEAGATVDFDAMRQRRLVAKQAEFVKVIATGQLTKNLTVKAHGFSAGARQQIKAAGGTCETVKL